ncbi:MAG TPA: DUF6702 family protein, partial [Gemmatimonadales bacterium]|nr:DUF6702 family protein [Gemmatimonadales bacterium]
MSLARLAVLAWTLLLGVHPMHTAVTELAQDDPRSATTVQIKVFADDFQAAVPLASDPAAADSAMARYVRGTFALADRTGRPVRLTWVGAEQAGDVLLLRLSAAVPGGLPGARV